MVFRRDGFSGAMVFPAPESMAGGIANAAGQWFLVG